jgi:glycosyltransferase involved in cell wall biosynthesis
MAQTLNSARRWLLRLGAPEGSRRRQLLRQGSSLVRRCLLHQVQAVDGRWLSPAAPPLDIYDPRVLNRFLRKIGAAPLTWSVKDAETSEAGGARLALGLLQARPDLRRQFPRALSEREGGGYCAWLCSEGPGTYGLSPPVVAHLRAVFARPYSHPVWRVLDHRPEVMRSLPLVLTPPGQRALLRWLLSFGKSAYGLQDEEVWWFLFECAEDPYAGVAATFLRTASWQERFPHGLTVFGQDELFSWVRGYYRIRADWLGTVDLSHFYHPVDQLRLLHAAKPELQRLAPRAFRDPADTVQLVEWLRRRGPRPRGLDEVWWDRFEAGLSAGLPHDLGVNILGHFCYPSGLREAARATLRGLHSAGVRTSCRDVPASIQTDLPGRAAYLGQERFDTTLLHLAPEPLVDVCYPFSGLAPARGTYRIAVWYWELEAIPPEWARHARTIQEIWAPTRFIGQAMRSAMPIPVVDMLPGVELGHVPPLPRSYFGLPDDKYVFLFMFDMCSVMERKNPLAVIEAFRRAFQPHDSTTLVIKVARGNSDPVSLRHLLETAASANVMVIDHLMPRDESYALMNACDAYVSLHRSEGFGLTMAEAMLLGKPVIATGYSGNLDFMTAENSFLVDYRRMPITQDLPFYRKGSVWADPNVDEAADRMRWLFEHAEDGRALGGRAQRNTRRLLSLEAAGRRMRDRLVALHGRTNLPPLKGSFSGRPSPW